MLSLKELPKAFLIISVLILIFVICHECLECARAKLCPEPSVSRSPSTRRSSRNPFIESSFERDVSLEIPVHAEIIVIPNVREHPQENNNDNEHGTTIPKLTPVVRAEENIIN